MERIRKPFLYEYDIKILLAWEQAIAGSSDFFYFLLNNGFPELAALANAIRGDQKALKWLLDNHYPEFAALSDAIDAEEEAMKWLIRHNYLFYAIFADACRGMQDAQRWLKKNGGDLFLRIAQTVYDVLRDQQDMSWDYHKIRL
jgi:hypothetical protein